MLFGIRERKGFIQITGEVGAGKTTVCRALLEELGPSYLTALILNPCSRRRSSCARSCPSSGWSRGSSTESAYLEMLNHFLLDQAEAGNDVVLLIDEAQDLEPDLLEQIRLLSNLETDQRKLLQIVLLGQPELREKLNAGAAPAPAAHHGALSPGALSPGSRWSATSRIASRWRAATAGRRFTRGRFGTIYRYSGGVPRLVNAVCDKALLYGYVEGTTTAARAVARRSASWRGRLVSLIDEALKRAQEAEPARGREEPGASLDAGASAGRGPRAAPRRGEAGAADLRRRRRSGRPGLSGPRRRERGRAGRPDADGAGGRAAAIPAPTAVPTLSESLVNTPVATTSSVAAAAPSARPRPTKVGIPQGEDVSASVVEVPAPPSVLDAGRTYVGVAHLPEGRRSSSAGSSGPRRRPGRC